MKHAHKFRAIRSYCPNVILITLLDLIIIPLILFTIVNLGNDEWLEQYTWWLLIVMLSFQLLVNCNRSSGYYTTVLPMPSMSLVLLGWLSGVLIVLAINQLLPLIASSNKVYFGLWTLITPIVILGCHHSLQKLAERISTDYNQQRIAIVGTTELSHHLKDIILKNKGIHDNFIGFFDDVVDNEYQESHLDGNLHQLVEKAKAGHINTVYITLPLKFEQKIQTLTQQLADTTASVYLIPDLFALKLLRPTLYCLDGLPIISIYDTPFLGVTRFSKRLFDIVVGLMILLIILLPLVLIAIAIKFNSSGPVLFKQRRYGLNGEEIVVWKFRSMTVCEDGNHINQATKNDPRVTKLGAFLRKTSLDEFPQFINVLQGRMSIVGPRPHAVAHNEWYRTQIEGYMLRHKIKPGITGLAQISGYRGETDTLDKMENRIYYDLLYIQNWSLWLDIKIIFLTIYKGFMSAGAY